jgi:hypothetical protein
MLSVVMRNVTAPFIYKLMLLPSKESLELIPTRKSQTFLGVIYNFTIS